MASITYLKQKIFRDNRNCLFRCFTNKLWCSARIYYRAAPLPNTVYVNDLPQALNETGSYLYADDSCIFYQDKDVEKIGRVLNEEFSSLLWMVAIHFGNDKTKAMFFFWMKSPPKLTISYGGYSLKQHITVVYLGCYLDCNLNGVSMACRAPKEINTKVNFLWRQSSYLNFSFRRLLFNALIQPHFDYGCTSWYPVLSKALKTKLQIAEDKCISFCFELPPRGHMNPYHFRKTQWFATERRVELCTSTTVFKYWKEILPFSLNNMFMPSLNNYKLDFRWQWIYHFVEQLKGKKVCDFLD